MIRGRMNVDAYAQLVAHGLYPERARSKADLFNACAQVIGEMDGASAWFVPGRVEVLGKHTDYCGGRSVVAAVDKGIVVIGRPRRDRTVAIHNVGLRDSCAFVLDAELEPTVGHWTNYPMTVARRIARDFEGPLVGADIVLSSDLPPASGMSSSSALIIASFLAMAFANRLEQSPLYRRELGDTARLASYVAAVESGTAFGPFRADHGVGTAGGSEDHTAILCSVQGKLGVYSYRPVRLERHVDFPAGYVLVICSSGVAAEKTGAARGLYNRASRLASEGCELAACKLGCNADDFATLSRLFDETEVLEALGDGEHAARYRHFNAESNAIIPGAVESLASGDLQSWGAAVRESQRLAESLLGNQVPETVFLAESARNAGAVASSAFGAGFGGSVWAMVDESLSKDFASVWRDAYLSRFPQHAQSAQWFESRPGPAAFSFDVNP